MIRGHFLLASMFNWQFVVVVVVVHEQHVFKFDSC